MSGIWLLIHNHRSNHYSAWNSEKSISCQKSLFLFLLLLWLYLCQYVQPTALVLVSPSRMWWDCFVIVMITNAWFCSFSQKIVFAICIVLLDILLQLMANVPVKEKKDGFFDDMSHHFLFCCFSPNQPECFDDESRSWRTLNDKSIKKV